MFQSGRFLFRTLEYPPFLALPADKHGWEGFILLMIGEVSWEKILGGKILVEVWRILIKEKVLMRGSW